MQIDGLPFKCSHDAKMSKTALIICRMSIDVFGLR